MFKYFFITTLLLFTVSPSFAEIILSENIRPKVKSLVNPNIQRLEIPPTPNNMNLVKELSAGEQVPKVQKHA